MNNPKEIKKYCNFYGYSDVHPYEVVRVVSDQTVEIRPMGHSENKAKMNWVAGGFAGHCTNNYSQEYDYYSLPDAEVIRVRWSKANKTWQRGKYMKFGMSDSPRYFYDYNF